MNRIGRSFGAMLRAATVAMACTAAVATLPAAAAQPGRWATGYFAVYNYSGVMNTAQMDYSLLTHVIYWPVIPLANGTLNRARSSAR